MKASFVSFCSVRPVSLSSALIVALTAPRAHAQATLIHDYELNGSFSDALGGPSLFAAAPAGLGATGYTFAADQGLTLSNWTAPSDPTTDGNARLGSPYGVPKADFYGALSQVSTRPPGVGL